MNHTPIFRIPFVISLAATLVLPLIITTAHAQETIFVPINNNWKAAAQLDKNTTEFIPSIEKDESWTRRVTIKEMPGKKVSSEIYAANLQNEIKQSGQCTKFATVKPVETPDKGFEESVMTFQCLQKDGSSKVLMSKTMESPSGVYEVRYSFITDTKGQYNGKNLKDYLSEEVVMFIQLVQLCDNNVKDRACPLMN